MMATTPPPPTSSPRLSDADCYTCRRRRVKCDRVLPRCAKCARAQIECLGYRKPFVWNIGIASRGKMMGKTFPVPASPQSKSQSAGKEKSRPSPRKIVFYEPPRATELCGAVVGGPSPASSTASEEEMDVETSESELSYASSPESYETSWENASQALVSRPARNVKYTLSAFNPSFFGDLNENGRYYLQYFDKRVCRDLILFERYGDNPYRNLLPMAAQNPPFLHAALAVAARHHSNNSGSPEAYALEYKSRAHEYLLSALKTQNSGANIVTEPVLATMLLLLFFEALDSGMNTWKIHLQAARGLIQLSGGMRGIKGCMSSMLSVLVTHVVAIDIIGRSLAFSGPESEYQPWGSSLSEVFESLKEAEDYTFLGCPAELLEIILCITLVNKSPSTAGIMITNNISDKNFIPPAETLLTRIHAFDPFHWLQTRMLNKELQTKLSTAEINPCELFHHVSAYKYAVKIFAAQLLSPPLPPLTEANKSKLTDELIFHLAKLSPGSVLYKGAVWPVFLAGTGATSEKQRNFVRNALTNIWEVLPQSNIKNARVLLEELWSGRDMAGGRVNGGCDWKEMLEKSGVDWLFI